MLSGGTFCAVQEATLNDDIQIVIKTSVPDQARPDGRTPLLTYERDLLRSEIATLEALAAVDTVPVPEVLLTDFSRRQADVDILVMSHIPGVAWDTATQHMTPAANKRAWQQVGGILAGIHSVTAIRFGYPAADFVLGATSWPAFVDMLIHTATDDAATWGVDIESERLLAALDAVRPTLVDVTQPRLIHNDLWPGNVLVDPHSGEVQGIVDLERALYGDPIQDLCGSESMNTGEPNAALVDGYLQAGGSFEAETGTGPALGANARARLALYRLWAMSVQFIEIVPRGFHGAWVAHHRATIAANRHELFRQLGV